LPFTARDLRRFVEAVQEFTIARRSLLETDQSSSAKSKSLGGSLSAVSTGR
jgi:hypothetical protein